MQASKNLQRRALSDERPCVICFYSIAPLWIDTWRIESAAAHPISDLRAKLSANKKSKPSKARQGELLEAEDVGHAFILATRPENQ